MWAGLGWKWYIYLLKFRWLKLSHVAQLITKETGKYGLGRGRRFGKSWPVSETTSKGLNLTLIEKLVHPNSRQDRRGIGRGSPTSHKAAPQ